jgi:hypothetical protein
LEDLDIDGSIILKYMFKKWDGGMHWFDLIPDRLALVNAIMDFRVP